MYINKIFRIFAQNFNIMTHNYCITLSAEDKDKYKQLFDNGENQYSIAAYIYTWQQANNVMPHEFPTSEQLERFIKESKEKVKAASSIARKFSVTKENSTTLEQLKEKGLDIPLDILTRLYNVGVRAESKNVLTRRKDYVNDITNPQTRIDRESLIYDWFMGIVKAEQKKYSDKGEYISFKDAINNLSTSGPVGIFERIKDTHLYGYILNEDVIVQRLAQQLKARGLSDDESIKRAQGTYDSVLKKYVQILNNYSTICENACNIIFSTTGVKIRYNSNESVDTDYNNQDENDNPDNYIDMDDESRVSSKDNVYNSYNENSHASTLSVEVRNMLSNLPLMIRKADGTVKYVTDDLGRQRKVYMSDAHAVLVNLLRNCVDSSDIIPTLQRNVKKFPWISELLKWFEVNDNMSIEEQNIASDIFTAFSVNMIGAWVGYIHEIVSANDNGILVKTQDINHAEDYGYWIDRWTQNINGNTVLTTDPDYSIYDNAGNYYIDRIKKVTANVDRIIKEYTGSRKTYNAPSQEEIDISKSKILDANNNMTQLTKDLLESLRSIGVDVSEDALINTLMDTSISQEEDSKGNTKTKYNEPFIGLAKNIKNVLKAISDDLNSKSDKSNIDLNNISKSHYFRISRYFTSEANDLAEMHLRENGVTRYAHIKDNFIFKFLKQVKDLNKTKEVPDAYKEKYNNYFEYFINEEFKKYPFFYSPVSGYNIDILNLLENDKDFRDNFDIKVVLTQGNKEVSELSDSDMMLSMLAEYNYAKGRKQSKDEEYAESQRGYSFARYYLPLPAEAGTGYVATMPKYHNSENTIPLLFTNVISQEYNRIFDVIHRDRLFRMYDEKTQTGLDPRVHMQDNFDIVRDKDGNIKNIGGAEFKFFTDMNDNKVRVYINGTDIVRDPDESYDKAAIIELPELFVSIYEYLNGEKADGNLPENIMEVIKASLDGEFRNFKKYARSIGLDKISKSGINLALGTESYKKTKSKNIVQLLNILNSISVKMKNVSVYENAGAHSQTLTGIFENLLSNIYGLQEKDYHTSDIYNDYINSTKTTSKMLEFIDKFVYTEMKDVLAYNSSNSNPYSEKSDANYYSSDVNDDKLNYILDNLYQLSDIVSSLTNSNVYNDIFNKIENKTEKELKDFFYNFTYAQCELIQLITGDIAQYKNVKDWIKRAKEYHANGDRLNVKAKWNGELVSKDGFEKFFIAKDFGKPSNSYEAIEYIVNKHVKNSTERAFILKEFSDINTTDAQTFRTLKSYRKIAIMHHDWNQNLENSYNRIISGKWNYKDFESIFEAIKPYGFSHITDTWVDEQGIEHLEKRAIQIKTAESVMLTMYAAIAGEGNNNTSFAALNKFMSDNDIDMVVFESAIKVGGKAKVDLSELFNGNRNASEIQSMLSNTLGNDSEFIQRFPLSDMLIQHPVPEHFTDATQLLGTQIKKLILADTNPETILHIQGLGNSIIIKGRTVDTTNGIKFKDVIDLYQELYTDNLLDAYRSVAGQFKTIDDLSQALKNHISSSATYSMDMLSAVEVVADPNNPSQKVFNIPLHDNIMKNKIENLLHSIINNNIIKQKIAGGTCTQVSSFAYSDKLHIIYKDGDNVLKTKDEFLKEGKTEEEYKKYVTGRANAIAYVECYAPCFNTKLADYLKQFANPKTGILDVNNIPEKEREYICRCVGYRIPTEDKYSMVPLKIIGFLPSNMSSSIMLPNDWIAISGSDFDADKLYIMVRELEDSAIDTSNIKNIPEQERVQYLKDQKKQIKSIKYDGSKSSNDQGNAATAIKARNNMIVSIMEAILTSPDCADKILNPGNFNEQKKAAVMCNILHDVNPQIINDNEMTYNNMRNMTLKQLEKFYEDYASKQHPLSPETWVKNHSRISSSGALIGVFASLSSSHPYFQIANIGIASKYHYNIDGNNNQSFAPIRNYNGRTISKLMSSRVNSAVDDVKYPTLADCNINMFTAAAVNIMSMKGDEIHSIALFLQQPIIKDMCDTFFGNSENASNKRYAINAAIEKYIKLIQEKDGSFNSQAFEQSTNFSQVVINSDDNIHDIIYSRNIDSNDEDYLNYLKRQLMIGLLYKNIFMIANDVSDLNKFFRTDTSNGSGGPTIADTMSIDATADKVIEKLQSKSYSLTHVDGIIRRGIINGDIEQIRDGILNSKIPMAQAAFTLGIESVRKLFSKYLPYFSDAYHDSVSGILPRLRKLTKTGNISSRLTNRVFIESALYTISGTTDENGLSMFDSFTLDNGETIKVGDVYKGKVMTSADMISLWIYEFPSIVERMKKNTHVSSNPFLRRFYIDAGKSKKGKTNSIRTIKFRGIGNDANTRNKMETFWFSAMKDSDPIVARYAKQLFIYSGLTNAFGFGPNSWIQYANTFSKEIADERYINGLRSIESAFILGDEFFEMFVRNHLYEREICPLLKVKDFDILDKKVFKQSFTVNPYQLSTASQKQAIQEEDGEDIVLHKYIAFSNPEDGSEVYYQLRDDGITYDRIQPLGSKYKMYVYNKTHGQAITIQDLANATNRKPIAIYRKNKSKKESYSEKIAEYNTSLTREIATNDPKTLFLTFEFNSKLKDLKEGNSMNLLVTPNSNSNSTFKMIDYNIANILQAWSTGAFDRIAIPSIRVLETSKIYTNMDDASKQYLNAKLTELINKIEGINTTVDTQDTDIHENNFKRTEEPTRKVNPLTKLINKSRITLSNENKGENTQGLCE